MSSQTRKADYRALLLLVLALVPVAGALLGTIGFWRAEEGSLRALEQSNDPVEASYLWFAAFDDFEATRFKMQVAAWPNATATDVAEAAAKKRDALKSLAATEADLKPLADRIADELGLEPALFSNRVTDLFTQSRRVLEAQQPGEPVLEEFAPVSDGLGDAFLGRYLPAGDTPDATLRVHRLVMYDLLGYHRAMRQRLAKATTALDPSSPAGTTLPVVPQSSIEAATLSGLWSRLTFNSSLIADGGDFLLVATPEGSDLVEPTTRIFRYAQVVSTSGTLSLDENRRSLASEIVELTEDVRADADDLYARSTERGSVIEAAVRSRQRSATIVGALLSLLAFGLLALAVSEIQHRRKIEQSHRGALDRLDSKAQTDPLTEVGNRRRFERVLQHRLDRQDEDGPVVLAYVDLDRFKALNDVWGRTSGDHVLRIIARRFRRVRLAGAPIEVIRFGGDEFICFTSVPNAKQGDATALGDQLLAAVRQPIVVRSERHQLTATAGVAVSDAQSTADSLLLEADRSLMLGKRTQRGSTVTSDEATAQSSRLVKILPAALQNGEITCHYQPVFSIATGELLHVEALSRWEFGDGERISPATFVPLIEAFGMSSSLTRSVLRNISRVMASEDVPDHVGFWLNVAPLELEEFDFVDRLLSDVALLNLPPERLAIEITETAAISDPVHFAQQVGRLAEVGIEIAIDDFGSGYSPLGYLQDLPVDVVKIDRSLITHIDSHASNQQLLTGIIGMLKLQGRKIVAEGVERAEELTWLHEHGVDMVQGYLTARPSPASEVDWAQRPVASVL